MPQVSPEDGLRAFMEVDLSLGPRRLQHPSATPRLTIRCEYPDTDLPPTEVTFRLSPSYGLTTGHEANEWFLLMMRSYDEFVVETDRGGEAPMPFWSETVRQVMVE